MTEEQGAPSRESFPVRLENFEGPFDLLLTLIAKHRLDVTEVALAQVTDDFVAHLRARGPSWDLGQATSFLVVAATLLDLKASRLLPGATVEDEEDLELLAERDLLFARLLEYRAFKQVAAHLAGLEAAGMRRHVRTAALEPRLAALLPEVVLAVGPHQLRDLAVAVFTPKEPPTVSVAHVHAPKVSVREQAALLRERLPALGAATFRELTADCGGTPEVVARFLALLDLYREGVVLFTQDDPFGSLLVRWAPGEGALPAPREEQP